MRRLVQRLWFLIIVQPVVRGAIGVAVFGRQHLRQDGPVVFAANHNSHLDAIVLMSLLRWRDLPRVRPVAAADYFDRGMVRRFLAQWCMNALLVPRRNIRKANNPLTLMIDALDNGDGLILFPEGTRGEPEELAEFKTGIAHLAARRSGTRIVPVYMRNVGFALPRGRMILVPMFCDVFVGPPLTLTGTREEMMETLRKAFDALGRRAERIRRAAAPEDDR